MRKESIKDVIEFGGNIKIPFKRSIDSWYSELEIAKLGNREYVIQPGWQKFSNVDDAINWFLDLGRTSKNKGYIQSRLMDKGIIDDDCDLENPNAKLKKLFKEEGKIVDEEAKLLNIVVKPLPKEKDALSEIESIVKGLTIDNLKDNLLSFEEKYMSLNPYINLNFDYETESEYGYNIGTDYKTFSNEKYKELSSYTSKSFKPAFKKFVYKNISLTIKFENSEHKFYDLNF